MSFRDQVRNTRRYIYVATLRAISAVSSESAQLLRTTGVPVQFSELILQKASPAMLIEERNWLWLSLSDAAPLFIHQTAQGEEALPKGKIFRELGASAYTDLSDPYKNLVGQKCLFVMKSRAVRVGMRDLTADSQVMLGGGNSYYDGVPVPYSEFDEVARVALQAGYVKL